MNRVTVIGLGGIGTHLVEPLCRYLVYEKKEDWSGRVVLVDGDRYEDKNRQRQRFSINANKAQVTKELLEPLFPELSIEAKSHYVTQDNVQMFIREDDVVFLAVDNHATRKIVNDEVGLRNNLLLISGGNDLYDGNVQVYQRKDNEDVTRPLIYQHPEIEHPKDKNPGEAGCDVLAAEGNAQLLAVNLTIASFMLNTFVLYNMKGQSPYQELYFDLQTGSARAVTIKNKG